MKSSTFEKLLEFLKCFPAIIRDTKMASTKNVHSCVCVCVSAFTALRCVNETLKLGPITCRFHKKPLYCDKERRDSFQGLSARCKMEGSSTLCVCSSLNCV